MTDDPIRLVTVIGARPQFVKSAAFSAAVHDANRDGGRHLSEVVVHTGQHYEASMSDVFFEQLTLDKPSHYLGVGSGPHGEQTGAMMTKIESVCDLERPDAMVVFGDTNSTLAASLVAAKSHIPLVHIEAGLRSFDRTMPEEVNRVVSDHVAQVLLAPTERARANLAAEGVTDGVHVVGDVMLDVFLSARRQLRIEGSATGSPRAVVTIHRPANTDDPAHMKAIVDGIGRLASGGYEVIWPVHPRLRSQMTSFDIADEVQIIEPVGYLEMVALLHSSTVVITDSGGLQKEALWSERPCVTVRPSTEWVETVEAGWNQLVPPDAPAIVAAATRTPPTGPPPACYGTGGASRRSVDAIVSYLQQQ